MEENEKEEQDPTTFVSPAKRVRILSFLNVGIFEYLLDNI
jgi:hypothetical protein